MDLARSHFRMGWVAEPASHLAHYFGASDFEHRGQSAPDLAKNGTNGCAQEITDVFSQIDEYEKEIARRTKTALKTEPAPMEVNRRPRGTPLTSDNKTYRLSSKFIPQYRFLARRE